MASAEGKTRREAARGLEERASSSGGRRSAADSNALQNIAAEFRAIRKDFRPIRKDFRPLKSMIAANLQATVQLGKRSDKDAEERAELPSRIVAELAKGQAWIARQREIVDQILPTERQLIEDELVSLIGKPALEHAQPGTLDALIAIGSMKRHWVDELERGAVTDLCLALEHELGAALRRSGNTVDLGDRPSFGDFAHAALQADPPLRRIGLALELAQVVKLRNDASHSNRVLDPGSFAKLWRVTFGSDGQEGVLLLLLKCVPSSE